jgi:hypothetical protein
LPARKAYEEAERHLAKLVAEEPTIVDYQHDWALCAMEYAFTLDQQLRLAIKAAPQKSDPWAALAQDTEKWWYAALERWKKTNASHPGELRIAGPLVKTYERLDAFHKLMAASWRKLATDKAEAQAVRRVQLLRELTAAKPEERAAKEAVGEALLSVAFLRVEAKNAAGAAQNIDEFCKLVSAGWAKYYQAAAVLALCVAVADKTLKGTEREEAIKGYGDRAVQILQDAVAAGWSDAAFLQKHPLLQPLRDRPEYRKQLEKLQKSMAQP